ncbi:MAG: hypothetical protein V3R43_03250, partial [bacterium]
ATDPASCTGRKVGDPSEPGGVVLDVLGSVFIILTKLGPGVTEKTLREGLFPPLSLRGPSLQKRLPTL